MFEPFYTVSVVTPAADAPLTLEDAKAQCRISDDVTDDDALLESYLPVAAQLVEELSGQTLLAETWKYVATGFPAHRGIPVRLPKVPFGEVISVQYRDQTDTLQTWDPSEYRVIDTGRFGAIVPQLGQSYPVTRNRVTGDQVPDDVQIILTCGYPDIASIPARLMLAQKVLVAYWYANPESVGEPTDTGVENIIGVPAVVDPCW